MKYSVLMAVCGKDDPDYLPAALRSIYEDQTRKPDEIVIVFDGPLTERQYQIFELFQKDKAEIVTYCPQERNSGLGEALRIGSNYCTGDYIFRMDSDDISDSERFERQIEYLEQHPDIDVLGTDIAEFDRSFDEKKRIRICPTEHGDIVKRAKTRNPMNHVSVCIKRSALEHAGGYENLLLLEDYYLWLKMIVSGCKLANIHESLVYVRVGGGFHSKRGSKERVDGWKVLQRYMLDHGMIGKIQAIRNILYINVFVRISPKVKKMLYDRFLRD